MKFRSRILAAVFLGLCFWSAETVGLRVSLAAKHEEKIKELKGKIQGEEQIVRKIKKRKATVFGALETMDRRIAETEKSYRMAQDQVAKLTRELEGIQRDLDALDAQVREQESASATRLTAFYRLGRAGALPVLFSENPLPEKLRNLNAMRRILGADWERLRSFHVCVERKEAKEEALNKRRIRQVELKGAVHKRMEEQKEERREKDELLFQLGQDEQIHVQLIKEMKAREKALARLIQEEEEKREKDRIQSNGLASGSLESLKGKLPWPVKGDLYRGYGRTFDPLHRTTMMNRGIDIRTREGEPVRCVWGGEVVFADWFQGYGKLVIVHHGEKDYTVLAHMERLTKRGHERVEPGEIIGYAGDTGSMEGCLVHFEVWHNGAHCDPLGWIRRGKHASKLGIREGIDRNSKRR